MKRVVMGLDKFKRTPCGFSFVEYYNRQVDSLLSDVPVPDIDIARYLACRQAFSALAKKFCWKHYNFPF